MRAERSLWLVAIAAGLLRAIPVLVAGPWRYLVDYDEGVYFTSSALLAQGVWPWRDFAFVHPPGVLLALLPASGLTGALGTVTAFALARVLAATVGAITCLLLGQLLWKRLGPIAGLTAAVLYACYPEAITTERGPFIEPWLNLACLLAVTQLFARRYAIAGALFAAALATKGWGALWLPAAVLGWWLSPQARLAELGWALLGFTLAAAVLLGPFIAMAPEAFVHQVLAMQLGRPPDGTQGVWPRLGEMFNARHLGPSLLALAALAGWRWWRLETAVWLTPFVLTVVAFCVTPTYWSQYNGHLALAHCALAGLGAAALARWRPQWRRAALVLVPLAALPAVRNVIKFQPAPTDELVTLRTALADLPGCRFAFEPTWLLTAGQLPTRQGLEPLVVDSYGAMLSAALPGRYVDTASAMQSPLAQQLIRSAMGACPVAILGWRGHWQLDDEWLRLNYQPRATSAPDVWVKP